MTSDVGGTYSSLITPSVGNTSWASLTSEILYQIFSSLDPITLSKCQRVCRWWKQCSEDVHLYQTFLKKLLYFSEKNPEVYFADTNIRERFLTLYKQTLPVGIEKKNHYEFLVNTQLSDKKMWVREEWNKLLPDPSHFANPLSQGNTFDVCRSFPYQENKDRLIALIHLGGLENEGEETNRAFSLACLFGDKQLVDIILSKKEIKESNANGLKLYGFFMAFLGSQEQMYAYLDSLCVDYNTDFSLDLKFLDLIYSQVENTSTLACSTLLTFLKNKGAEATFAPTAEL